MCTEDSPMVKANKEESYTSKAKSLVKYPKFKGKEKAHTKDEEQEAIEDEKPARPTTYKVTKPSSEDVSRQDITELISESKVLENPVLISELFDLVNKFLKENSAEEWDSQFNFHRPKDLPDTHFQHIDVII